MGAVVVDLMDKTTDLMLPVFEKEAVAAVFAGHMQYGVLGFSTD